MKLLMITRKVDKNDHLAGFIYNWVKKIGSQVDELRVISWQEGDSSGLPENIKIWHLPTNCNKLFKIYKLKVLVWKNLKDVDGLFCHQMPIYTIIAGPLARIRKKKVVSWYMHKQVDWRVKLMEKIANVILSASKESFRLASKKLVVTGHGIDVDLFSPKQKTANEIFEIITVGRISPTKDYESMIKAVDILKDQGINNISLKIIGDAGLAEQKSYLDSLKQMVEKTGLSQQVKFLGAVPNNKIPEHLTVSDLFINMSGTGSVDKAVLEAMACECLVLTSNEAFKDILPPELLVEENNPKELAEKINRMIDLSKDRDFRHKLRQEVIDNHNLNNLAKKIIEQFK